MADYPGAAEACDGVDNNCDGAVDEGLTTTFYADADRDMYGDPSHWTEACSAPANTVTDNTDCDDDKRMVHPGATESCDTPWDEDCDSVADELGAIDCQVYYRDLDVDGYGDASDSACSCVPSGFYTANNHSTDCDDSAATVNPGASEVCSDGVDQDCDGADITASSLYCAVEYIGQRGDYTGSTVSGAGDVDADGYPDLFIGAALNADGGEGAGAAYLVLGGATPRSISVVAADAEYTGAGGDAVGWALASAGDVDADGYDDMLIGAYGNGDAALYAGAAYLVRGGPTPASISLAAADAEYTGAAEYDQAGVRVAGAGDVDADGCDDLLIGAYGNRDGRYPAGAAYLILGSATPASMSLTFADAEYAGPGGRTHAGSPVSGAGDVNADGYDDLLIGADENDDGGTSAGAVYLVLGGAFPTSTNLSAVDAEYQGEAGDRAGFSLSGAGDVNADGYGDILVGAPYRPGVGSETGAAYLVLGGPSQSSLSLHSANAEYSGEGVEDYDRAGSSVSGAGDVDADGYADFLIGTGLADPGRAYVVNGSSAPSSGSLGWPDSMYDGEGSYNYAGCSVAGPGDVDGNGHDDLLIGALGNTDGGTLAGAAYLVLN